MNPLAALPNKNKLTAALSKLKYLVIIDPLRTETGEFWKNYGNSNNVKPEDIKTEVIMLPANVHYEEAGSFTSSGRVAQWHWAAAEPPGEAKIDREIIGSLFMKLREMYAKDGGKFPDPIMKLTWNYANPNLPSAGGIAARNQRPCARPTWLIRRTRPSCWSKAGEQMPGFGLLQDDGSTACGNWLYCGVWSQAGNQTARVATPTIQGISATNLTWGYLVAGQPARALQPRQRRSDGKPWDAKRGGIRWDGTRWVGIDVPDIAPDTRAG